MSAGTMALRLTERQRRIVLLLLERHGRREIAHRLGVGVPTVRKQIDAARRANGLRDEVELLIAADRELRGA